MRFAGQRMRLGRFTEPNHRAQDGSIPDMNYRYQAQGLPSSMATMSEVNAANFTKSAEGVHREAEFVIPQFST